MAFALDFLLGRMKFDLVVHKSSFGLELPEFAGSGCGGFKATVTPKLQTAKLDRKMEHGVSDTMPLCL